MYKGYDSISPLGLAMCCFSTFTQCAQIILSGKVMRGSKVKLDGLQMTAYTGAPSFATLLPVAIFTEKHKFASSLSTQPATVLLFLLGTSVLAVLYNVVLFQALSSLSVIGTSMLGNVKIVLLLVLSAIYLGELHTWSMTQLAGCVVTFVASGVYTYLKATRAKQ